MVRIEVDAFNDASGNRNTPDVPLTFSDAGNLNKGITATKFNVVKFSLPSGNIPLMYFDPTDYYSFTMTYGGFSFTQQVLMENRGSGNDIYEVDHLVSMLNTAIYQCMVGLSNLVSLPVTNTCCPYLSYDNETSLFNLTAVGSVNSVLAFQTPSPYNVPLTTNINLYCNRLVYTILQTTPCIWGGTNAIPIIRFLFSKNPNTQYVPPFPPTGSLGTYNYLQIQQEAITTGNWASCRYIILTTSMPSESEVVSQTGNNNDVDAKIIENYTIPYENGIKDKYGYINYSTVENGYRSCRINASNLYLIKIDAFYRTNKGQTKPLLLPPNTMASVLMEFL